MNCLAVAIDPCRIKTALATREACIFCAALGLSRGTLSFGHLIFCRPPPEPSPSFSTPRLSFSSSSTRCRSLRAIYSPTPNPINTPLHLLL